MNRTQQALIIDVTAKVLDYSIAALMCAGAQADFTEELASCTQRYRPQRSQPRPAHHVKPHARHAYKG